jgi:hypothetical protein
MKIVPKAGNDIRTLKKIGQLKRSKDENLPITEKKSWTESAPASGTKFELVSTFKQANRNFPFIFLF